jgi:hypothetical protein
MIDIWPAYGSDEAIGIRIQNTRVQIETALHAESDLS